MNRAAFRVSVAFCLVNTALSIRCARAARNTRDPGLGQLRHELAMRYLHPEPHLALAKYHWSRGNRLLAFYISEYARRELIAPEEFQPAFRAAFVDEEPFDNSAGAERRLRSRVEAQPTDEKAMLKLADVFISRSDWKPAEVMLRRAMTAAPEDETPVGVLGEVLRRDGREAEATKLREDFQRAHPDSPMALLAACRELPGGPAAKETCLRAAVAKRPRDAGLRFALASALNDEDKAAEAESEFVEAARLAPRNAEIQGWTGRFFLKRQRDRSRALEYYLNAYFLDPDFYDTEYAEGRIRGLTFTAADEDPWDDRPLRFLLEKMSSDDEADRWRAIEAFSKRSKDAIEGPTRGLLADEDLRRRGLGAYAAVAIWGRSSAPELEKLLANPAELVRYDAMSALLMKGGSWGRETVRRHLEIEKDPRLKERILSALEASPTVPAG